MGSSYTFFKPLDLSRSKIQRKKKKKNSLMLILIRISFIISYLWHSILISKPKKGYRLLSFSPPLQVSLCSLSPPLPWCSTSTAKSRAAKINKSKKLVTYSRSLENSTNVHFIPYICVVLISAYYPMLNLWSCGFCTKIIN